MRRLSVVLFSAFVLTLSLAIPAISSVPTTVDRTIIEDPTRPNRLAEGPGDPYLSLDALCPPQQCTDPTPKLDGTYLNLANISDMHVIDEESPARLEFLDFSFVSGAYRPMEAFGLHVANAAVSAVNDSVSPVTGLAPQIAIQTGDNADSKQENEIEWNIDLLDGGPINPNSGDPDYAPQGCDPAQYPTRPYQGVRGRRLLGNGHYGPNLGEASGNGYSDIESENVETHNRHVALRKFQGLFKEAQDSFQADGLDIPWYTTFGNHDALWQGNFLQEILGAPSPTGCYKKLGGPQQIVQPDSKRRLLGHQEWIAKHFDNPGGPGPQGHGFVNPGSAQGYYSFTPAQAPKIRMIGLDTPNQNGLANGIIEDEQFQWLDNELADVAAKGQKAIVFHHHSLRTMDNPTGPVRPVHCGLPNQRTRCNPYESLVELYWRHNVVLADINGHEHRNNIELRAEPGGNGKVIEITTASEIDWPQYWRLVEIQENNDGSHTIRGTLVDANSPIDPGENPDLNDPFAIASISRELSQNDIQGETGEDGMPNAAGEDEDRNVEILIKN